MKTTLELYKNILIFWKKFPTGFYLKIRLGILFSSCTFQTCPNIPEVPIHYFHASHTLLQEENWISLSEKIQAY